MPEVIYTDSESQVTVETSDDTVSVLLSAVETESTVITPAPSSTEQIATTADPIVIVSPPEITSVIINSIETGPQGIQGPAGATVITYPASTAIGGHRIVVLNADKEVEYADHTTLTHANKVVGMSTGAAVEDADVTIQTHGETTESSWSWTLDTPIWLSTTGLMTQTPPATGFSLIVGFPISATKMFIDLREPIFLV